MPPLLAGYFGHGNAGDEMILALLERRLGPAPFLSGPRPAGGLAVPRFHVIEILRQLRRCRALVLGGGELFQSRTSVRSLLYYLALPLAARVAGRPVLGFSLATDPELGPMGRWGCAAVLRRSRALWIREEASRRFLEKRGIPSRPMPDVVWSWPVPAFPRPRALRRVLWILRCPALGRHVASLHAAFRSSPKDLEHGFLAFSPEEDGPALARFRNGVEAFHRLETWSTPDEVFERIARYDLVVTMRYHGLVAAALSNRPVLAIPGHGKVSDLARELDASIVPLSSLSFADWPRVLSRAFERGLPSVEEHRRRAIDAVEELAGVLSDISLHN